MAAVRSFVNSLLSIVPPWLRRTNGAKLLGAIGDVFDAERQKVVDGVKLRFPTDTPDPDALILIGRERRIRRGPDETDVTYARRLRGWWDAHRRRGSPYAMLEQLFAFFFDTYDVQMDIVAQSGLRHSINPAGVITRDKITWTGGGPNFGWAHVWVFFHVTAVLDLSVTSDDETLETDGGDDIVVTTLFSGTISDDDAEVFRAIPRDWSAGHIPYVTVVLLYETATLWGYPSPAPNTWADNTDGTWGGPVPVILIAE